MFTSISDISKFRSHCLCGKELLFNFKHFLHHSSFNSFVFSDIQDLSLNSDLTPILTYNIQKGGGSKSLDKDSFKLRINILDNNIQVISSSELSKKSLNIDNQIYIDLHLFISCNCEFHYSLTSQSIIFDFEKNEYESLSLDTESFIIKMEDKSIKFITYFKENKTKIEVNSANYPFILPRQVIYTLSASKLGNFTKEDLIKKAKMMMLFS